MRFGVCGCAGRAEVVLLALNHGVWGFLILYVLPLLQLVWEPQCHQLRSALRYLDYLCVCVYIYFLYFFFYLMLCSGSQNSTFLIYKKKVQILKHSSQLHQKSRAGLHCSSSRNFVAQDTVLLELYVLL